MEENFLDMRNCLDENKRMIIKNKKTIAFLMDIMKQKKSEAFDIIR